MWPKACGGNLERPGAARADPSSAGAARPASSVRVMSAALLLNPLLGAAPVDPVRPLSPGDSGFAGVLADATAVVAETGGEAANGSAGTAAPTLAPAPANGAVISSLLRAAASEDLTTPADLTVPDAAASALLVAAAAPASSASAGLSAAGPAGPTTTAPVESLPASTVSLSAEAPAGTAAQRPGANEVPVNGDAGARLPIAPASSGDAASPSGGMSPTVAGATASAAPAEAPAPAASGPAATVPEGLTTSASAAPTAVIVADVRGVPAATGAVQAQLAATGAALATKSTARRTDAPADSGAAQPTMAFAPDGGTDSAELAVEPELSAPVTSTGGTPALNGQAAAAGGPQGAATGGPAQAAGVAAATAEAKPAPVLAEADAELISPETPTDLPAGETARLPETPLPTTSSLVLQPMVNDGRFNAVAQISAQILRRLEGQTTRFELALTPEDLGRVDVMLEIDGDGAVNARLAFDNPAAAAELRAQADQLRRELEAAGLNVGRDGLQFAERDARRDDGGSDRRGAKAFAGAARLEADADAGVVTYRMTTADGRLDVRI